MLASREHDRLVFLARVVKRGCDYLEGTTRRLFTEPFTPARAATLEIGSSLSEQVEAFVSRFSGLQDTVVDKLLTLYLQAFGDTPGANIGNLDWAERLGFVDSAETWGVVRQLINRMIHDYVEDPVILADAISTAESHVSMLVSTAEHILDNAQSRGWIR